MLYLFLIKAGPLSLLTFGSLFACPCIVTLFSICSILEHDPPPVLDPRPKEYPSPSTPGPGVPERGGSCYMEKVDSVKYL